MLLKVIAKGDKIKLTGDVTFWCARDLAGSDRTVRAGRDLRRKRLTRRVLIRVFAGSGGEPARAFHDRHFLVGRPAHRESRPPRLNEVS
jgi:hypothetical protein